MCSSAVWSSVFAITALVWCHAIEVAHSELVEVYHINPHEKGPVPLNMDTGDALGDLFFDLKMVLMQPLTCSTPGSYFHKDCGNPETDAPDLVINKLRLEVSGPWSGYALCNIGLENDTDTYGNPCEKGRYCCFCGDIFRGPIVPCNATVGLENVREHMRWPSPDLCNASAPDWMCWQTKIFQKLPPSRPGWWYSTLDYGYCDLHPKSPTNCTWRVASVEKIITKVCHQNSFLTAIEAYNRTCFLNCGHSRNISSTCWTRCFYNVVLGPEASKPGGEVAGVPVEELLDAWLLPFASEDPLQGGCPRIGQSSAYTDHREAEPRTKGAFDVVV